MLAADRCVIARSGVPQQAHATAAASVSSWGDTLKDDAADQSMVSVIRQDCSRTYQSSWS